MNECSLEFVSQQGVWFLRYQPSHSSR